MEIILVTLKFIIANVLLVVLSSTLIGFIVRGIFQPRTKIPESGEHKIEWYGMSPVVGLLYSFFATCVTIILLFWILENSNIYIITGFVLSMLTRIKDLKKEIKTGQKTNKQTLSNDSYDIILNILSWTGFIIFNFGFYKFLYTS